MSSLQRFFVASCIAVSRPRFDLVELPKGDKRKAPISVLQAPILAAQLFLPIFGQTRCRRRRRWPSPRWVSGTVGCCQAGPRCTFSNLFPRCSNAAQLVSALALNNPGGHTQTPLLQCPWASIAGGANDRRAESLEREFFYLDLLATCRTGFLRGGQSYFPKVFSYDVLEVRRLGGGGWTTSVWDFETAVLRVWLPLQSALPPAAMLSSQTKTRQSKKLSVLFSQFAVPCVLISIAAGLYISPQEEDSERGRVFKSIVCVRVRK